MPPKRRWGNTENQHLCELFDDLTMDPKLVGDLEYSMQTQIDEKNVDKPRTEIPTSTCGIPASICRNSYKYLWESTSTFRKRLENRHFKCFQIKRANLNFKLSILSFALHARKRGKIGFSSFRKRGPVGESHCSNAIHSTVHPCLMSIRVQALGTNLRQNDI